MYLLRRMRSFKYSSYDILCCRYYIFSSSKEMYYFYLQMILTYISYFTTQNRFNKTAIHNDLDIIMKWSIDWLMPFNTDKCKTLHMGYNNPNLTHNWGPDKIKVFDEDDLDIILSSDFKVSNQCIKAANTANQILGMINKTIVCKHADIILPLFKSLVRPHIVYCIQAWRPWLQKDFIEKPYWKGFKRELLKWWWQLRI